MRARPIGSGNLTPRIPREFAALIAALQLKGANVEALLELTQREWESLLQFCEPAHLTLLLAQAETGAFPVWVKERLKKNKADNAIRFERIKAAYYEVAAALDRAGVEYIVLKGFAQAPEFVADARLRMQSDLDLYCPKEMIHHARAALQSIGYQSDRSCVSDVADHLPVMVRRGNWQRRGNFFDPDLPLGIELHFCFWNEGVSRISLPEVDCFWDRRTVRKHEGMSFPALNAVDHLGYLALHILRGLLLRDWIIHHVHELAVFLHKRADDDAFWIAWKRTHSSHLRALQTIAFSHAVSWFCCDVHESIAATMRQLSPGVQEWLRRFAGSSLEGMFSPNKDSVWLHLALLDPPVKKYPLLRRAFLPLRAPRLGAPAVRLKNRQPRRFVSRNLYMQYISYVVSRLLSHCCADIRSLRGGLGWWFAARHPLKRSQGEA